MDKVFFILLSVLLFSEVISWTVDLEEVKKLLLENEVQSYENSDDEIKNIESDLLEDNYARNFGYQGYNEKEASSVIRNGSVYLDGLSKALMTYRQTLTKCSLTKTDNKPNSESKEKSNDILSTCGSATNNSEYVQKLSELALLTTNKLRDKAYDKDYKDDERNENELLLQLAWLLDRLAYLTGYEPNPKDFIETESSTLENKESDVTEKVTTESLEILEQTENGRPLSKNAPTKLTAVKSIQKRSAEPLEAVMKYYSESVRREAIACGLSSFVPSKEPARSRCSRLMSLTILKIHLDEERERIKVFKWKFWRE
ncbi:uncharacterized protein LOC124541344 [Vanessa cardui]|uniref:uncharacterized protein LOC124541344 n=1 Tax=Vanessa cardui TaxID=171605 RepID=UPI001F12A604|nr:uncharacterized protein LOC124541344 [Vanessa cardui]